MYAMAKRLMMFCLLLGIFFSYSSAISISCTTGDGSSAVSSSTTYNLDDSTSLREMVELDRSEISQDRYASGSGKNSLTQNVAGNDYSAELSIDSVGSFSTSSSVRASESEAALSLGLAATGDAAMSLQASRGEEASGQAAAVSGGAISSLQSLSTGQDVSSRQDTEMAGMEGYVGSKAFSQQNDIVATGRFLGVGILDADLEAKAAKESISSGQVSLNGVTYLSDSTFQQISSESIGLGIMGLRQAGDSIGSFEMKVSNRMSADDLSYGQAAAVPPGGYTSSYDLLKDEDTGRTIKWTQNNPRIQLYLNPNGMPSGLTSTASRDAISAAANTWDNAVAQNLFIDTNTVLVDSSKVVDDPYSEIPKSDDYNVHGWWTLSGDTLGLSRYWYVPSSVVGGYESIVESDVWYDQDRSWTTDWNTAVSQGKIDLQSAATHELGHSIGMGDIYYPILPANDPRTLDYEQVMNLYDAPQRTLGNGDRTGVQVLYGRIDGAIPVYRMYSPYTTDHFYTTNYAEYTTGAVNVGYQQEGLMGYIYPNSLSGTVPIYRMYSPYTTDHFYTTYYAEYTTGAVNVGYQQEGLMGYIYPNSLSGMVPIYRMYSPYVTDHFYTTNYAEYTTGAVNVGYQQEGLMGFMLS